MDAALLVKEGCLEADGEKGVMVRIHVQPRAAKNGFCGIHGGSVKLRITAPPVDGKANELIIAILAKLFHVPKTAVAITSGQQSRQKRFRVAGVGLDSAMHTLATALGQ